MLICHDGSTDSRRNNEADALADRGRLSDIAEVEENPVPHPMRSAMKAGLTDIEEAICRRARIKRPPDQDIEDIRHKEDVEESHQDEDKENIHATHTVTPLHQSPSYRAPPSMLVQPVPCITTPLNLNRLSGRKELRLPAQLGLKSQPWLKTCTVLPGGMSLTTERTWTGNGLRRVFEVKFASRIRPNRYRRPTV